MSRSKKVSSEQCYFVEIRIKAKMNNETLSALCSPALLLFSYFYLRSQLTLSHVLRQIPLFSVPVTVPPYPHPRSIAKPSREPHSAIKTRHVSPSQPRTTPPCDRTAKLLAAQRRKGEVPSCTSFYVLKGDHGGRRTADGERRTLRSNCG